MSRIRSIKPEFWVSEQVAECSTNARLTFIGLWNFCDDNGVHPAKPKTLKAELYPMDDFAAAQVEGWMHELMQAGLVVEFTGSDGERYWHVTGWARHQKIDRPSVKYPSPPPKDSTTTRRTLDEDSTTARRAPPPGVEGKGVERKGVESRSPKARTLTQACSPGDEAASAQSAARSVRPECPEGVTHQTWTDFLQLRKAKKAPVTTTVVESAKVEATKAGLDLEAFLRVWCARGSQGLEADWLKPHERLAQTRAHHGFAEGIQ